MKIDRYGSGRSKLDGPLKSERSRVKKDGHLTNEKGHKYQNGRVIDHVIYMLYAKLDGTNESLVIRLFAKYA